MRARTTRDEVLRKVTEYVRREYAGNWKAAFDSEDRDADGSLDVHEVIGILVKARIGTRLNRWLVALAIIDEMDSDEDGAVSWPEFEAVFNG